MREDGPRGDPLCGRFAHPKLEPVWNWNYIECVEIASVGLFGVEDPGVDVELAQMGGEGTTHTEVLLEAPIARKSVRCTPQDEVEEKWRILRRCSTRCLP